MYRYFGIGIYRYFVSVFFFNLTSIAKCSITFWFISSNCLSTPTKSVFADAKKFFSAGKNRSAVRCSVIQSDGSGSNSSTVVSATFSASPFRSSSATVAIDFRSAFISCSISVRL